LDSGAGVCPPKGGPPGPPTPGNVCRVTTGFGMKPPLPWHSETKVVGAMVVVRVCLWRE
jgi:hypothetical protein